VNDRAASNQFSWLPTFTSSSWHVIFIRAFLEQVDIASLERPDKRLAGGFILGGVEFIDWVKQKFLSSRPNDKEVPRLKQIKSGANVAGIVAAVGAEFDCKPVQILTKGKKRNMARDVAIYLARDSANMDCTQLGRYFGNISGADITMRYKHMEGQLMRNKKLKTRIDRIAKQLIENN